MFAEEMRKQLLKPPQGVDAKALEFEAKMGCIKLNDTFKQQIDQVCRGGEKLHKPV